MQCGYGTVSWTLPKSACASLTPQPGPVDQAQDQRDAEEYPERVPGDGQGGGEREPERDHREAPDDLDQALDDVVDPAAIIARDAAQIKILKTRSNLHAAGVDRTLARITTFVIDVKL